MKDLKGSKTEQNLRAAFSGESEARNKYTYFASKAKKDGFEQISAIFEETAGNEKSMLKSFKLERHRHDRGKPCGAAASIMSGRDGEFRGEAKEGL